MKILHTADWHLGQRFCDRSRQEEHQAFLNWLLLLMEQERPDALIVAGDIFDTGSPPSKAQSLYYNFLVKCQGLCKNIIITGGNHDSPSTLEAPRTLLQALNIQVVGSVFEDLNKQIIPVYSSEDAVIGAVGAVPFLRDRDIRNAVAGEENSERVARIKAGIKAHYEAITELLLPYKEKGLPILCTGHLFAAGVSPSDSEREIHIGNLGNVTADSFPADLDYVALGHIHKPQVVGKKEHIRYSGSPIPLSFSERKDKKQVLIVNFEDGQLATITPHQVPCYRQLKRIKGDVEKVKQLLLSFPDTLSDGQLTTWAEIIVQVDRYHPSLDADVRNWAAGKALEILAVRLEYLQQAQSLNEQLAQNKNLEDLSVQEVFEKRLDSKGLEGEARSNIQHTFNELLDWMRERD